MKSMRKAVCVISVLSLPLVMVACSSSNSTSGGSDKSAAVQSNSSSQSQQASETNSGKRDKIKYYTVDLAQPIPAVPSMQVPTIKYMADKTNTDLDITYLANDKYREQLKLKFAAGDYPDAFMANGLNDPFASEVLNNDIVLPLNDLIDKYGPNLKKNIPQDVWDAVTINGKIMAIPEPQPGNAPAEKLFYVRKDWLDKLGLQPPKTSDEFLDMLRAFRDKDPNGNGKKDEIPFSMRDKLSWDNNIFGMFGINDTDMTVYNGEVIPGFIHPNAKKALAIMHTMYQEKLLDPEFLTNTRQIWVQKIMSDTVGSWVHVAQDGWTWQNDINHALPNKTPKPDVVAIPTPRGTGYDGPLGRVDMYVLQSQFILKTAKNPAAIVRWFDWLASDEGQTFASLGLEGVSYKKENGKLVYDGEADKKAGWDYLRPNLFTIVNNNPDVIAAKLGNPDAYEKLNHSFTVAKAEGIPNPLAAMPYPKIFSDNPDLLQTGSLWQTAATKIILGEAPLDSFDDFVKTWKSQGGDEAIKEMTAWYNKNKKQ